MYPAEKGMWAEMTNGQMGITGLMANGEIPSLMRSISTDAAHEDRFIYVSFEKNPRNAAPGKHVKMSTERLEILYDGATLQKLIDCFTWPEGVELQK